MLRLVRPHLAALVAAFALVGVLSPSPAAAKPIVSPRSFTGYGFDTCTAPTQAQMDAWWLSSPFSVVGIYVAGASRSCRQPELTRGWVARQARTGWRFLPIYLGRQAPCEPRKPLISWKPRRAEQQGRDAAALMVQRARDLGIGKGSVFYNDIEWYDVRRARCNEVVLSYISGWTKALHRRGYVSGLYSSASAAIAAVDTARRENPRRYRLPDQIWFGWSNGRADTKTCTRHACYASNKGWSSHKRIHQYVLDTSARYGGVTMHIDRNWVDVGRGSFARKPTGTCGRPGGFARFRVKQRGDSGPLVELAQCLLRQRGLLGREISGQFGRPTVRAVRQFQDRHKLPVDGVLGRRTWTALLGAGGQPVLKYGHNLQAVWRLQRALTAGTGTRLAKTGVFDRDTGAAVRTYERAIGMPANGVVDKHFWQAINRGRVVR